MYTVYVEKKIVLLFFLLLVCGFLENMCACVWVREGECVHPERVTMSSCYLSSTTNFCLWHFFPHRETFADGKSALSPECCIWTENQRQMTSIIKNNNKRVRSGFPSRLCSERLIRTYLKNRFSERDKEARARSRRPDVKCVSGEWRLKVSWKARRVCSSLSLLIGNVTWVGLYTHTHTHALSLLWWCL